jgi:hypothetical protein
MRNNESPINKQSKPFIFSTIWNVKAASHNISALQLQENKYKNIHKMALHEHKLSEMYRGVADTPTKTIEISETLVTDRQLEVDEPLALISNEAEIARKKYYDINSKHKDLLLKFAKLYSDHAAIVTENKKLRHSSEILSIGNAELLDAYNKLLEKYVKLERENIELKQTYKDLDNKYQRLQKTYDEMCHHNLEYMAQLVLNRAESASSDSFEHITYEDTD